MHAQVSVWSLLDDSVDMSRANHMLVPFVSICLAFSDVLSVVDFYGGTRPQGPHGAKSQ